MQRVRDFLREWRGFFVFIVLMFAFRSAVADWYMVPTGSMNPTIIEGDRIFVDKLAYDLKIPFTTFALSTWDNPKRGDIVVFYSPADGKRLIKRVMGLPGDIVTLRDNRLTINGQPVSYREEDAHLRREITEQEQHRIQVSAAASPARHYGPYTVPENRYFVLGDNRDNSADSRYIGPVPRQAIVGRAKMVIVSLAHADRFFIPFE